MKKNSKMLKFLTSWVKFRLLYPPKVEKVALIQVDFVQKMIYLQIKLLKIKYLKFQQIRA